MIRVSIYADAKGVYRGIAIKGHAGYGEYGQDILCAAVSALSTNTVNSIEKFSADHITVRTDESLGELYMRLDTRRDSTSQLLMKSLELGLESIAEEYGSNYVKILHKEV